MQFSSSFGNRSMTSNWQLHYLILRQLVNGQRNNFTIKSSVTNLLFSLINCVYLEFSQDKYRFCIIQYIRINQQKHKYKLSFLIIFLCYITVTHIQKTYFSVACTIFEQQSDLNSGSQFSRKESSSFIMPRMLLVLTRAKDNSIARLENTCKMFHWLFGVKFGIKYNNVKKLIYYISSLIYFFISFY